MTHVRASLPHRRTTVKVLHWTTLPLFIWFMFVTPEDVNKIGPWAFQVHSVLGLIFVTLALVWTVSYIRKGLVGRAGPKLGPRMKQMHQILHKTLIWGLFGVAVTGFALGLTASVQLWAANIVPVAYPLDLPDWNKVAGQLHIIEFYALAAIAIFHAGFHIWRHVKLKDNALRIIAPKHMHKYL